MDPNCKIIELEKEREEVLYKIAVLQRERAELSIEITKEWQADSIREAIEAELAIESEHLPQNEAETTPVAQDRTPSTK